MEKIIQEVLQTPVKKECDVLVCGGGFAGIAAAIAAARSGKKVILTERLFMLGGLGTSGLVTIYLPLCDGYGKQVSFGLAEELLRLSVEVVKYEDRGTKNWLQSDDPSGRTVNDPRFAVEFNPHLFAVSAEQLLLKEGVKILYGTIAVAAQVAGDKITAIIVENKSGRFAIAARSYVDCTGDADLAVFSGAPTALYGDTNMLAAWYYYFRRGEGGLGEKKLKMLGYCEVPEEEETAIKTELPSVSDQFFQGVDADEISLFMELSHASMLSDVLKNRKSDPTYEPVTMTSMPQYRKTRRVDGAYTQCKAESHVYFADSIGMVSSWRQRGPVYEVPFRTLYAPQVKNLLFSGRCTSVADDLWELMRVIPCCSVTGEAAGVAAAMTDDFPALDVSVLQSELKRRGVVLHEQDLENPDQYTAEGVLL